MGEKNEVLKTVNKSQKLKTKIYSETCQECFTSMVESNLPYEEN